MSIQLLQHNLRELSCHLGILLRIEDDCDGIINDLQVRRNDCEPCLPGATTKSRQLRRETEKIILMTSNIQIIHFEKKNHLIR